MIVAALTGGIASGKSEVLKVARSLPRVETIQTDNIAKEIYDPDNPCFQEVRRLFGSKVITDKGSIDIKKVSEMVFSDPALLTELEKISHPYVKGRIEGIVECLAGENIRMAVIEIPLFFQSHSVEFDTFDLVILVRATEKQQLERLVERDGISVEEAKKRIDLQRLPENAEEKSDYVIDTQGTLDETRNTAKNLLTDILD